MAAGTSMLPVLIHVFSTFFQEGADRTGLTPEQTSIPPDGPTHQGVTRGNSVVSFSLNPNKPISRRTSMVSISTVT